MIRITLVTGEKITGVTLTDYVKPNGEVFTIASKGNDLYLIDSRDADRVYWKQI